MRSGITLHVISNETREQVAVKEEEEFLGVQHKACPWVFFFLIPAALVITTVARSLWLKLPVWFEYSQASFVLWTGCCCVYPQGSSQVCGLGAVAFIR